MRFIGRLQRQGERSLKIDIPKAIRSEVRRMLEGKEIRVTIEEYKEVG
jgi:hypothetical protein